MKYKKKHNGMYIVLKKVYEACDNICDWILETDQIVTLGLFHFIGPTNGYTHALHMYIHSASIRLG